MKPAHGGEGSDMNEQQIVGDHLREVAKACGLAYYGEVAALIGLDLSRPEERTTLFDLLAEICKEEHRLERPMLCAIVVSRQSGVPGRGFFGLARDLGLLDASALGGTGKDMIRRTEFWTAEVRRVHDCWRA